MLGDCAVKELKIGKGNLYLTENRFSGNVMWCVSDNQNNLLHMCDTYNCDYLKHSTFRFNLIDFQLNKDFPSQFCVFLP